MRRECIVDGPKIDVQDSTFAVQRPESTHSVSPPIVQPARVVMKVALLGVDIFWIWESALDAEFRLTPICLGIMSVTLSAGITMN